MEKINKLIQSVVMPVLLVITTVIGIFTNMQTSDLDAKSKALKNQMDSMTFVEKEKTMSREDIEFVRELKFKMFAEVKEAVKSKDEIYQQTVYEFVTQMLKDDDEFRDALLKTIKNSPKVSAELKNEINRNLTNATVFEEEEKDIQKQQTVASASSSNAKLRVDVFYLEETQEKSQAVAAAIKSLLEKKYDVRLRILPKLKNSLRGYQVYNNEIRFEESEKAAANEIASIVNPKLKETVFEKTIHYRTYNYISVFIRNL